MLLLAALLAGVPHYSVKLTADVERQELRGEQVLELEADAGILVLRKKPALAITRSSGGRVTVEAETVRVELARSGKQRLHFEYVATVGRGLRWLAEGAGFFTAFHCDAWMVCDDSPAQRATLRLEIALPASSPLRAVGPGSLKRSWRDMDKRRVLFELAEPAQTYLFSFGAARLLDSSRDEFSIHAQSSGHADAFRKTSLANAFFRSKAGTERPTRRYAQVFLQGVRGLGQEAAGMALMSEPYLAALEEKDDVYLMAHELAHQWWGVLVGIRSWSDFWLNEGMATFVANAFVERHQGRPAYEKRMADLRERLETLRKDGKDRPLHFEGWKDAGEALGEIPYVKGALFLDRLRTELGEDRFWRGIAQYTTRHARGLVDSRDFQRAMEEAAGRSLNAAFDEAVWRGGTP
jgi:aminopeptidase N